MMAFCVVQESVAQSATSEDLQREKQELEARVKNTLKKNGESIRFIENKGQINNPDVLYYFEGDQGSVYIEKERIRFVALKDTLIEEEHEHANNEEEEEELFEEEEDQRFITATHTFSLYLKDSKRNPTIRLGDSFTTKYNYFIGEEAQYWASGVQAAKELTLEDLYPGIDLRLYSTSEGAMEFDWVLEPGADFSKVKMQFSGQDRLDVDQAGNLQVGLHFTDVKFNIPESYQVTDQGKLPVHFAFTKLDEQTIHFTTHSTIDPRFPLIIDPTLTWGTFVDANHATFDAYLYAIEVDPADGMVYCAGGTNRQFPTGTAPYDADGYLNLVSNLSGAPSNPLPMVAVVYRINNTGTDLVDLTLYGPSAPGTSDEIFAEGLSLSSNSVFISGVTNVNIPLAGTSFDNTRNSGDGFVAVFSRDLGTLTYATYLGSTANEDIGATSIRAASDDSYYVGMTVGAALPANYISAGAADGTYAGGNEIYIAKFTSFNTLSFGTYVGGSNNNVFNDLEFFGDGRVAFAGYATGTMTEVNGAASSSNSTSTTDGVLGVLNNTGTAFNYLDKIGGSGNDRINDVEIVGNTLFWTGSASSGFPVSASGVYDITHNGSTDVVVGKVDQAGGAGTYGATFYGTASADIGNGIRLVTQTDCEGNETVFLLVFGTVGGAGLPVLNINGEPFYQATNMGGIDMFFAGFTNTLSTLLYGTYMGGSDNDYLGETGVPKGSNHLWVNNANVYLGTTTHSATHAPTLVAGGFDLSKTNGNNDSHIILTIAFNSIIAESDYSDAPATYGAPLHFLDCQDIRIGALLDKDAAALPGVQANGDDLNNLDDEDGISILPVLTTGGPQTFSVTVDNLLNTTGFTANLYGWIDLNGNGQFSSNEFASTTLVNGFTGSKTLTWTNVTVSGAATSRYLRIRLTSNNLNDNAGTTAVDERSTVSASNGEVEDYLAVELTCPTATTEASCQTQSAIDTKYNAWLATVKAGGGCNGVLTNNSPGPPSSCGGTRTVTFTYTSTCAPLTTQCTSTFTVNADTPPAIATCAVTRNITGCNTAAITTPAYSATTATSSEAVFEAAPNNGNASDACGITSVTYIDVATGVCPIVVTRTWTVTDVCGQTATCIQTINISETTLPGISCPPNVTITCTASTLPANTGTATATDNCTASPTVTYTDVTQSSPTCAQEYTITRTWRATDNCGNTSTCNQLITIDDSTPPVITCPPNLTIECTINTSPGSTGTATATDNCGAAPVITYTDVTVSSPRPLEYTITRTWVATDACGNSSSCNQVISVADSNPPVITQQPNNVNECIGGTTQMIVAVTGGSGPLAYQWQSSPNGTSGWANATGPGATTTTYTPSSAAAGTTYYRVIISTTIGGCGQVISNNATAIIVADPSATLAVDDNTICDGGSSIITATITGGTGTPTYQWQHDFPTAGTNWVNEGGNVNPYTTTALTPGTHTYRVLITQSGSACDAVSTTITITVSDDPTVSIINSNPNICNGGTSLLTASPSGGTGTNSYQWQQLVAAVWTNVSNNQAYTTDVLTTPGTYTYRVIVTQNSSGCLVVSSNTTVTVVDDPVVTVSPSALTICDGGTTLFTAAVTGGTGTSVFQWQSFNGTIWSNVGTNQNTYTTPALTVGTYTYRVLVSQASGCNAVSADQVVSVVADPTVTVAIAESTICSGGTTLLTATVSGGTGTTVYQWQFNTSGSTWANVGTNQDNYTTPVLTTAGTYTYRVLITQASGCSAQSANAVVNVVADPTVNITASSLNICDGGTTTFTAVVSGGTGTPLYQWQFNNSGTWTNVGTNNAVFTTPVLAVGSYSYRLIVTQATGCSVQSANQTVTVVADPTLSMSINNPTLCIGGTATLTATVSGGTGTSVYQWQENVLGSWTNIGTNQNSYTTPVLNANGTYTYRVIVTQNSGCSVMSADQIVTVVADPLITVEPVGFVECIGQSNSLTVSATGGTGTFTYQWQVGNTSTGPWNNVGTNSNSYTPPSASQQTLYYRVLISSSGAGCNLLTSAVATVLVTGPAVVTISVNNPIICVGGSSLISSTVTNGSGTYTYTWQRSPAGLNTWANAPLPNANPTYNVPAGTPATFDYRVLVHDVPWNCGNPVSNIVNVTIQSQPTISANTNDGYICIGGTALLTSTPVGGSGNFSYQWQSSATGNNPWTNISGATSQNYTAPGSAAGTTYYRVLLFDNSNNCADPISNVISVIVINQPTVSVSTLTPVICIGGAFLISSAVNNGSGLYAYQWQTSDNAAGPWSNIIINGDGPEYAEVLSASGVKYYRVIVDDLASGCGQMTSTVVSITVNPNPLVSVNPAGQTVCVGANAPMTAVVTNGSGNYVYQWEYSEDGSTWQDVASGGNGAVYTPPTVDVASIYYRVLVTDTGSGCENPYSEPVFVIVVPQPTVEVAVDNPVICIGGSATLTSTVLNGSGTYGYQWQQSNTGTSGWANVPANGNNANYAVPSVSANVRWYRLIVSDSANGCADPVSDTVRVTVRSLPTVTAATTENIICLGGNSTINSTVLNGSGFISYQWQLSVSGAGGPWSNITNLGNGSSYVAPGTVVGTRHYRVIITDVGSGCGSAVSNPVAVQVVNQPTISISVNNEVICVGGNATISTSILNGSGLYAYQWQSSPTGSTPWTNTGGNTSTYNITGTAPGTTYYRVILDDLANGCNNPVSSGLSVVVQSGPSVTISASEDSVCVFGAVEITPAVINGSGLYGYQWQSSSAGAGGPWTNISGATNDIYSPTTTAAGVTWYRVMVTDFGSGCGDPVSGAVRIAVFGQPDLTINIPVPVACVGGIAILTSSITNGSGVFVYQWQISPDATSWSDITVNGNTSSYSVPTTAPSSNYYRLILTDLVTNCVDPESNAIQVDVVSAASVSIAAPDDTVCLGAITTITSTITGGSGLYTYQWQQSLNGSSGWANVPSNGNTATYTVPTLTPQRYFYRILVTDSASGCADPISNTTPVTVQSEPVLNASANNPVVCINGSSLISTTITGGSGNFVYQWQSSPDGTSNWNNVPSGGSGPTYNVPTTVAGTYYYRIILTDTANGCDDPAPVVVMIHVEPQPTVAITASATNLCIGGASTITSVVTNGSGFVTYQWQSSPDGTAWSNITTLGNGVSYSVPTGTPNSTYYRVVVTDAANGCNDPVSNTVFIQIQNQPTVTISLNNPVVCIGGSALITSTVTNGTGNLSYQWQSSPTGNNPWTNVAVNGTNATYSPPTISAGTTYYRLVVTDAGNGCNDPVSSSVSFIVQPQPTVTIAVNNPLVCVGGSSTVSSTISNGSGLVNYQWQLSANGVSGWADISTNGTNATYDVPTSVAGTYYYRVIVTDLASGCNDPVSNVINVVVSPDLAVTTPPANVIECIGGTATMTVVVSGGSGTLSYQWQSSATGTDPWVNATGTGATTITFTPPSTVAGSTYYRVLVNASSSGCGQTVSDVAFATIYPDLLITVQPSPIAECIGGTATMSVTVTGGTGTVTYQWESSANGTNWNNATGPGSTTATYTPSSTVAGTTFYRVTINTPGSGCGAATSNSVTAIISQDITVTTQPTSITECIGGNLTMNVLVSGGSGTITYQWQSSPDGTSGWANASGGGATTSTYTPESLVAGTTFYRVLVNAGNNGCDQAVSNNATVTINPDLTITTQPTNMNECVGGTSQLNVVVTGGVGTVSYQWQSSPVGLNTWSNATGTGATTATFTPPSVTPGSLDYRVLINATGNGCGQAISQIATVIIDPDATVSVSPGSSEVCIGGSVVLTATLTGGSGLVSIQWQVNSSGWTDIPGQTSLTYSPSTAVAGTTQYRVRVIDISSGCSQPFSNISTVVVQNNATVSITVSNSEVCIDGSALLTATVTGGSTGITLQWQSSPNNVTWTNISGATSSTYNAPTSVAGTTWYRIQVTDSQPLCADPASNSLSVLVRPDPTVSVSAQFAEICIGGSSLLTAIVSGG